MTAAVIPQNGLLPGQRLADDDVLIAALANPKFSTQTGLTAAGTTRATSLQLNNVRIQNITTAAASSGVTLPVGNAGTQIIIFNNGASACQVYALASETIDGIAGATGVALSNAARCSYYCTAQGVWLSALLGAVSA